MCGFVAEIRFDDTGIDKKSLKARTQIINHRGPDDEGFYTDNWVGLGFKRLAIIDLSPAGHQPMSSQDKRFTIVFNGEIYNFKTLKAELESEGYRFKSSSDTEVVLRGFELWGVDVFAKLVGMFAIVITDTENQKTYVARDHLGIKPLYRMDHDGGIHFASEIKAFEPLTAFTLNEAVLYEHFSFGYVAGRQTLFGGIERVEPGTYLEITPNGDVQEHVFYDVTDGLKRRQSSIADLPAIETLLNDSIEGHTISDVGFNLQLSGGLDSSYIAAHLVSRDNQDLHSYSVSIEGPWDEREYQDFVTEKYPTEHHRFSYTGDDLVGSYIKATWHMDMPNVHLASPFLMMLCDESRKTSKVILTGEGADELFGGYSRFQISGLQRLGYWLHGVIPPWMIPNVPKLRALKPYLKENPVHGLQRVISKNALEPVLAIPETPFQYRDAAMAGVHGFENKMFASHQKCYLQSLLERQDKVSMAASVEARVPFCTWPLFDHMNAIQPRKKLENNRPKALFKTIAKRFFPDSFIDRRKSGFTLPVDEWLRDADGMGNFLDTLRRAPFTDLEYFNHDAIHTMIDQHISGDRNWHKELMVLINFDIWYQLFISKTLKL
jgi:asparagine synthase (glutamine-hydrolysing)